MLQRRLVVTGLVYARAFEKRVCVGLRGGGGALHGSECCSDADAGREQGALDLLAGDFEQSGDTVGIVAFDIAKQEDHALVGGQLLERLLHLGTLDVAAAQSLAGNGFGRRRLFVQGHALAQFIDQGAIDAATIRLLRLTERLNKGVLRDLFGFDLISYHVEGDGVGPMLVGLINVALPVFERSLGHLALDDPACSLRRKILFKFQRTCPQWWDG
jgi:hypothetical protein